MLEDKTHVDNEQG